MLLSLVASLVLAFSTSALPNPRTILLNGEEGPTQDAALDPVIVDFLKGFSATTVLANVKYLSGEDPASPIQTRQSQSAGGLLAAEWIRSQFTLYGWNSSFFYHNQATGYNPNIIGEIRGSDLANELVIIGAHYDDRQKDLNSRVDRAPGANDDGSGTAMLLEIARILGEAAKKKAPSSLFRRTVQIASFSGEEQGLYGSRAYASDLKSKKVVVAGMIQADMIGYHIPSKAIGASLVSRYTSPEYTALAKSIAEQYVPGFSVLSDAACCSDHQSFYENGYPAIGLVEQGGPNGQTSYTVDPQYHQPGDLANRDGFSSDQIVQIGKIAIAVAATTAELVP